MKTGEETGNKKRECPEEDDDEHSRRKSPQEEKAKKFRAQQSKEEPPALGDNVDTNTSAVDEKRASVPEPKIWDVETALLRLVGTDSDAKEFLGGDVFVRFRVGHSGDASSIAAFYRQSEDIPREAASTGEYTTQRNGEDDVSSTTLELWLADGLGDENTPPSVFSLLGDVYDGPGSPPRLNAVALMTLSWEQNERVLRVEWCHVNPSLTQALVLSRRIWLRLSTLAMMTACRMLVVQGSTFPGLRTDDYS